jgi:Trp operon repressor
MPRKLSDSQVKVILYWHERFLAWKALAKSLKTQRQLAKEFGVSQGTITRAVRLRGQYKQRC